MGRRTKGRLILALLLFAVIVLHTTLSPRMTILGATLNLPLMMVVFIALFRGAGAGFAWGLAAGLLLDLLAGRYIGMNMLSLMLCGYACGALFSQMHKGNFLLPIAATGAGAFIYALCYLLAGKIAGAQIAFFRSMWSDMLPMLIYTAVLSLPVYIIVYLIYQRGNDGQVGGFE